jgi:acetate---CoA ligase (ADP-forming)
LLICSEMVEAYPEIAEMDLNPVIVYESGARIVDARIILTDETTDPEPAPPCP